MQRSNRTELCDATRNKKQSRFETHLGSDATGDLFTFKFSWLGKISFKFVGNQVNLQLVKAKTLSNLVSVIFLQEKCCQQIYLAMIPEEC